MTQGPRCPRENEAPGGSLLFGDFKAQPSTRLLIAPWPFSHALDRLRKKIACYNHFKIPFIYDRTVSRDTFSRATIAPSALSRPAPPTPPTTHVLTLPRKGSRSRAVHFDSESSLQRLHQIQPFFTRCNLTQEIDPPEIFVSG